MEGPLPGGTRGILHARTGLERFRIERLEPPAALAPFVANFWVLRWDLRGRPPHRQRILTRPSVHVTFTSYLTAGTTRARIAGVVRDDFVEEIQGEGRVVGAAFRPGGFRPFMDAPVSTLTGRFPGVDEVFGEEGLNLAGEVFATADAHAAVWCWRRSCPPVRPSPTRPPPRPPRSSSGSRRGRAWCGSASWPRRSG
ncbi:DUF6597 domain-containing transcriptional factor [Actinomadura sp. NPDC048032]|uniref:DUF6597 domain-containing transcriptional factor n=1 Tax=Actinomadura sp. NPDC048032 TaxID=3155747 RepID=UPI003406FC33